MKGLFLGRAYPLALQIGASLVFAGIIAYGFLGPPHGEDNFAVVVTWMLWWLVLPISFVLLGRLWCAVCPSGAASDAVRRVFRIRGKAPGSLLRKGGIWGAGMTLLGFAWAGTVWGLDDSPGLTAVVLLALLSAAVLTGLVYERRAWCRYLCPVGLLAAFYSMLSIIGLRPHRQVCREECGSALCNGAGDSAKACPMFEIPAALEGNRDCNLCSACARRCPHGAMRLRLRHPFAELWRRRRVAGGEAFFIMVLMALVFLEVVRMTPLYPTYMKWLMEANALANYDLALSLTLLAMIGIGTASYRLGSGLSRVAGGGGARTGIARYAYAYVPLVLAGYLGATIQHLAAFGGRAAKVAVNQLALSATVFDLPAVSRGVNYGFDPALKAVQLALLLLGVAGAIYAAWRVARRANQPRPLAAAVPHLVLIGGFAVILFLLYLQPMGLLH